MKVKLRIIWESRIAKVILISFVVFCFALIIILPSVLNGRKHGELIAYNRDATSGTREAFAEKVLNEDPDTFTPGKNVLEASNNESMIKSVSKNKYSTAYVSAGTIVNMTDDSVAVKDGKKNIGISSFNGVTPTLNNIKNNYYEPQRNFNAFFRVEANSQESKIINWQAEDVSYLSDDLKASYAFYYWFEYSNEAANLINEGSEIAYDFDRERIDISKSDLDFYINKTKLDSNDIRIEIVGSSSAQASMEELTDYAEEQLSILYPEVNFEFIVATNGSGDAFSKKVPGTTGSDYIGMQSREAKPSEYEEWGYTIDNYSNVYKPFAIDAIIIIYNNQHLSEKDIILNTTQERMDKLYTSDDLLQFDEVFSMDGGDS